MASETVTQETPTQETPTQETPTQETPSQEPPIQETPLLSFLEVTRAYYRQVIESARGHPHPAEMPTEESPDAMLNRDIENYERYLVRRTAYPELTRFLAQVDTFRVLRDYDFQPSVPDSIPSFSLFRELNSSLGPAYHYPLIFDTYAKSITGAARSDTVAEYVRDRERIAEGDRRWLYGFSQNALNSDMLYLYSQRLKFRILDLSAVYTYPDVARLIRDICRPRIIHLTILIATETVIPPAERESILIDLHGTQLFFQVGLVDPTRSLPPSMTPISLHDLETVPAAPAASPVLESSEELDPPLSENERFQLVTEAEEDRELNMTLPELLEAYL